MSEVRMKGFKKYTDIDNALKKLFKAIGEVELGVETLHIDSALNRILAADIVSDTDIPRADRAAMDGYTVVAEDTFGASETNPLILTLMGRVDIGRTPDVEIHRGEAARVATGSLMPKGADSVVMVEYTKILPKGRVQVTRPTVPGQNVSKRGEDVKTGKVVLKKGLKIKPHDIGLMAALGRAEVEVVKKPQVAVISTGDELIDPGKRRGEASIYDVNRHVIKSAVLEAGGEPIDLGIAKDDPEDIRRRLKEGLSRADIVAISAGTSVGEKDLVPDIVASLGRPGMLVHGVSLRPGYPTGLAVVDGKPVILLPGYPVSNAIAFRTFVTPLIARMLGTEVDSEPRVKAKMVKRVATPGGLRTFVRVKISKGEGGLLAEPIRASGASVISSLTEADGLLIIPENSEGVDEGEEVEVVLTRPLKRVL